MIENQNVEFKSIWKDEWLKWICGMANTNGGIIYIGVDDNGKIIGINNVIKLVKELPNKIKDTMGIIPEVKVEEKDGLSYITINVEKYPVPITYQGRLYLRSGSNNHEITGIELERFMLEKAGKRWEDFPIIEATIDDLSEEALKYFREKAIKSGRLKKEDLDINNVTLLKKLGLYNGKYLNRAALLLFGKDPNRWIVGSIIKIGFFEKDNADLKYQDEVEGPILLQVDKALDLLYLKYFKGLIWYKDIQRIDEYIIPREACREILLNCINHPLSEASDKRCYAK